MSNIPEQLTEELQIWMDAEVADPLTLLKNDHDLLARSNVCLSEMRETLPKIDFEPEYFQQYRKLNDTLIKLLTIRVNKAAKIMSLGLKL